VDDGVRNRADRGRSGRRTIVEDVDILDHLPHSVRDPVQHLRHRGDRVVGHDEDGHSRRGVRPRRPTHERPGHEGMRAAALRATRRARILACGS
jgi:hypothetical protein